jgi:hypothetical protein
LKGKAREGDEKLVMNEGKEEMGKRSRGKWERERE